MPRETSAVVQKLISDPPRLHVWAGEQRIGGMGCEMGRQLVRHILARSPAETFDVLETGAGLSTLLFLASGATSVTSIDPSPGLRQRTMDEALGRRISIDRLEFFEERSELVLPGLAQGGREYDICLIDGAHTWPTVFVDFCYANMCLRKGGLLLIDDVHLHGVRQLFLLLASQPDYRRLSETREWKLAAFVKETSERFLPQQQPFLVANSGGLG